MILCAILAGGQARRFGGDKAAAEIDGIAMLDRVAAALADQCGAIVVVGRDWAGLARVDDLPEPGLGPLGGLAGALDHARRHGFDAVLTSGCDLPELPGDLLARLTPGPAVVAGQPLLGLWPVGLAEELLGYLGALSSKGEPEKPSPRREGASGGKEPALSLNRWIAASGARVVAFGAPIANINTPAELEAFRQADRRPSR